MADNKIYQVIRWLLPMLTLALTLSAPPALAQQDTAFVVEDIRIQGLRRFSPGVIFSRLPVSIGDTFSAEQATAIIQALYETGYFREVEVLRDENVLVVQIEENPTIAEVTVSGAYDLSDAALDNMLESANIAEARVFNQSVLDEAVRVIKGAYVDRNFYHVEVEAIVSPLPRNRVAVLLNIDEGDQALIRSIRISGNEVFSTWRLRRDMRLEPRGLLNFFTDNYRYTEQKLEADLSRIRTRYLEAGYLRFAVDARQVEISQDRKYIDIIIRVNEGLQYKISGSRFALEPGAPELPFSLDAFDRYIEQKPGDIYSGRLTGTTVREVRDDLADLGYANAVVSQDTEIDDETASVEVVYTIDPKKIVYIREINIVGNELTSDEVIRREFLQFETERYSRNKINRSRSRIRRLGYFNRVKIDTVPVEGGNDQVDLLVVVEEANTGEISAGAGFSSDGGVSYRAGFSNSNIFGTGNDLAFEAEKDENSIDFVFQLDEHYHTDQGVSRHIGLTYGKTDAGDDSSDYSIDGYKAEYGYVFPFTDDGKYNLYLAYQQVDVNSIANPEIYEPFINKHGDNFDTVILESGLSYDTRDAARIPSEGQRFQIDSELALPILELEYYYLNYLHDYYYTARRVPTEPVLHLRLGASYGDSYGDGEYPFYRRVYLGGANTLRGFAVNSIGYRNDSSGDAIGGKSRLYGTVELSTDAEFFEEQQIFLVPFVDAGAVGEDLGLGSFRSTWGVELRWLSPVGPLRFSYVKPLLSKSYDDTENFQFSISTF